jgi:hypothetical protein
MINIYKFIFVNMQKYIIREKREKIKEKIKEDK